MRPAKSNDQVAGGGRWSIRALCGDEMNFAADLLSWLLVDRGWTTLSLAVAAVRAPSDRWTATARLGVPGGEHGSILVAPKRGAGGRLAFDALERSPKGGDSLRSAGHRAWAWLAVGCVQRSFCCRVYLAPVLAGTVSSMPCSHEYTVNEYFMLFSTHKLRTCNLPSCRSSNLQPLAHTHHLGLFAGVHIQRQRCVAGFS